MKKMIVSLCLGALVISASAQAFFQSNAQPSKKRYYQGYPAPYAMNQPPVNRPPVQAPRQKQPAEMLEESMTRVLDYISSPQARDIVALEAFLNKEIVPHFDFEYMAKYVAGRYGKNMNEEQRQEFTRQFKEMFITSFVQKLAAYRMYPPVIDNFSSERTGQNDAKATATIIQDGGQVIEVDFSFVQSNKGWRVIDVKANDVSALMFYRNYFADKMRQKQYQKGMVSG